MKFRVSYLTAPESVRNAVDVCPTDNLANAYYAANFGLGKSRADFSKDVSWALSLGLYERVVNLNADSLEDVWAACNSVACYWPDALMMRDDVTFLTTKKLRSMSVGDLVDDGAGNYWVAASFGFEPVSLDGHKS